MCYEAGPGGGRRSHVQVELIVSCNTEEVELRVLWV